MSFLVIPGWRNSSLLLNRIAFSARKLDTFHSVRGIGLPPNHRPRTVTAFTNLSLVACDFPRAI